CVGTGARRVVLVARRHVGGAHRAAAYLAADPGPVAHLDRGCEAPLAGEAQVRLRLQRAVIRAVAQVLSHRRAVDDLSRVHQPVRVEGGLQLTHALVQLGAEDPLVQFAPGQPVAVLAAHHPAKLDRQVRRRLGQLPHRPHPGGRLQAHQRADVEAAGAGVGVEGRAGAVLRHQPQDLADVLGQVFNRDGDVLDAGDRLGVALDAHQQTQARLAYRPDVGLLLRVVDGQRVLHHALLGQVPGQALDLGAQLRLALAVELDGQDRVRVTLDEGDLPRVARLLAG